MIAENYINHLCCDNPCVRWWAHPLILVGGSIQNREDWDHIKNDFDISSVINVETEHDDAGKVDGPLLQVQVPDMGMPFPSVYVQCAVAFASVFIPEDKKVYVHGQQGGSRSPGFAYALLRGILKMNRAESIASLVEGNGKPYGNHPFHVTYMDSVDSALLPQTGFR